MEFVAIFEERVNNIPFDNTDYKLISTKREISIDKNNFSFIMKQNVSGSRGIIYHFFPSKEKSFAGLLTAHRTHIVPQR